MKRFLTVLTLILFAAPAFASYEDALELYSKGSYQDSLNMIASELSPANDSVGNEGNYKLRYLAAFNHWKMKNYSNSLIHLAKCREIKPSNVDPLIDMTFIYLDTMRLGDALANVKKILALDSKNSKGYYLFGMIKLKYGDFWGAKEFFEKSLAYDPELYAGWNGLGQTFMKLKRYPQANTAFSTALALNANSADITNNLALSYYYLKDYKKAKEYIAKASEMRPDNEVIIKNKQMIESAK